jgi:hypothetical protein
VNWYKLENTMLHDHSQGETGTNSAELKARIERAGGLITTGELRTATRRTEPAAAGFSRDREVWTFRGSDWVLGYSDGDFWQSMAPFRAWRQDADLRDSIPLTAGAKKWLTDFLKASDSLLGDGSDGQQTTEGPLCSCSSDGKARASKSSARAGAARP